MFRRLFAPVVTVIDFKGMIVAHELGGIRSRNVITYDRALQHVMRAFSPALAPKAVVLNIDSPGGSPGTTEMISSLIRKQSQQTKIPVLSFTQNVAASGGYWLMCTGDELYAMRTSLVGSIGAVLSGFGFHEMLKKIGVERRLLTAGKLKAPLDPFKPLTPEEGAVLEDVLQDIKDTFTKMVVERRGPHLKGDHDELFSGRIWTGREAAKLGLVDDVADMHSVLEDRYGRNIRLVLVNPPPVPPRWMQPWMPQWAAQLAGQTEMMSAADFGAELMAGVLHAAEEQAVRQRLGLFS